MAIIIESRLAIYTLVDGSRCGVTGTAIALFRRRFMINDIVLRVNSGV